VAPGDADLWVRPAALYRGRGSPGAGSRRTGRDTGPAQRPCAGHARDDGARASACEAGLPWFEQGLRFHPDDAGLLVEYAATLGDMGRNRDMLAAVRRLAQADPGEPRIFYLQAVLAARAGRSELARSLLQRTGTALRDLPGAMLLGGVLEYRAGNYAGLPGCSNGWPVFSPAIWRPSSCWHGSRRGATTGRSSCAGMRLRGSRLPLLSQGAGGAQLAGPGAEGARAGHAASAGLSRAEGGAADEAGGGRGPFVSIPPDQPLGALSLRYQDAPNFAGVAVPYVRGLLAARQGDQARVVADRLRDANPGASQAWLVAGDVRMLGGDPRGAGAQYEQAATIRFGEPVLRRLDAALRASGQPRTADTVTARYLDANPQSLSAMRLLLAAWREEGRMAEAAAMERALRARGV
jgi:tetratricopeptide (TPR) repeat protein